MKVKEKQLAIELRQQGHTIPEIEKLVGCPRSSIHNWVKDVSVPDNYLDKLKSRQILFSEKRALSTRESWKQKYSEAIQDYDPPFDDPRFMLGLGLYLGEGYKYGRFTVGMVNCQSSILVAFRKWIDEFFKLPETSYAAHVKLHDPTLSEKAVEWWSKQLDVPKEKFFKTTVEANKKTLKKMNVLEYGTCAFYVQGKDSWKIGARIRQAMKLFTAKYGVMDEFFSEDR